MEIGVVVKAESGDASVSNGCPLRKRAYLTMMSIGMVHRWQHGQARMRSETRCRRRRQKIDAPAAAATQNEKSVVLLT